MFLWWRTLCSLLTLQVMGLSLLSLARRLSGEGMEQWGMLFVLIHIAIPYGVNSLSMQEAMGPRTAWRSSTVSLLLSFTS